MDLEVKMYSIALTTYYFITSLITYNNALIEKRWIIKVDLYGDHEEHLNTIKKNE